jgi:hypothetical protein
MMPRRRGGPRGMAAATGPLERAGEPDAALHHLLSVPPMSERQAEQIAQIIAARPSPASLMVWELTLTCGHITRRTAHRDHGRYGLTTDCSECGGEPRGVVAQVQVGPADEVARAEEEAAATRAVSSPKRPKLADVRRKLRAAEAQAEALRLQLAQMQQADPGD